MLVDLSGDAVLILDADGAILDVNARVRELLGRASKHLPGMNVRDLLFAGDVQAVPLKFDRVLAGETVRTTRRIRLPGKREFYAEANCRMMPDGRIFVTVRDVTERRKAVQRILEMVNLELQNCGEELLDTLGQKLTAISFMMQALHGDLTHEESRHAKTAGDIATVVTQALGDARRIARGLSLLDLSTEGLAAALRDLADTTRQMRGVKCSVRIRPSTQIRNHATAQHLYQIAKEATANAVRHGEAERVIVELTASRTVGRLVVSDNGQGFRRKRPTGDGIGLQIMQYRTELIDGELNIETSPGSGTVVTCTFPNAE